MSENSKIEWTDHTFNPWIGCQKVGPGCDHCYAEAMMDHRMHKVQWGPGAARLRTTPTNWAKPLAWNAKHEQFFAQHGRRQRVFCASLADVFDNAVELDWRRDLFDLIRATPNLDWLLLTKRIGIAQRLFDECHMDPPDGGSGYDWPKNVRLGATFCNQEEWDRDADKLFAVPVQLHFGSFEPLLSEINLLQCPECGGGGATSGHYFSETGTATCERCHGTGVRKYLDLGWAIAGGESGRGARPMHPSWARSLRDQCAGADVPFLFKQWGEWADADYCVGGDWIVAFLGDGDVVARVGKKAAGRLLDGVQHDGFPVPL